jgi:NTE family protein
MNDKHNLNKIYDTICLSGGGIAGIAFIGALHYLSLNNFINLLLIKNFAGTSIGAIIAFLLALKYSIDEIYEFILTFNFKTLEIDYSLDNLFEYYGINNGIKFNHMFSNFIINKYKLDDITFKELYNITTNKLLIIGTNYSTKCEEIFSYDTTPDMSILLAVRISMSIPILFTPVFYNSYYYLDGALVNNFPLNHCNKKSTLGLLLNPIHNKNTNDNDIDIISLLKASIELIIGSTSKYKIEYNEINIIKIDTVFTNLVNYDFTTEQKKLLINNGIKYAQYFINKLSNYDIKFKDKETQTEN